MFRLVDSARFAGPRKTTSGRLVELQAKTSTTGVKLSLKADAQRHELGPWFLDSVMHTPTLLVEMKDALLSCADDLLAPTAMRLDDLDNAPLAASTSEEQFRAESAYKLEDLAKGDDVAYGTVYMSPNPGGLAVVYEVPSDQDAGRFHVAWDPVGAKVINFFIDGFRRDRGELFS